MSWLSKYVFDPFVAAFARSQSSANALPSVANTTGGAAMTQVGAAITALGQQAVAGTLTANSALGLANGLVGGLEDTLRGGVDALVTGLVGEVPIAGAFLAPVAVDAANMALEFAESHAHDYIASLFHHAKGQIAGAAVDPTQGSGSTASSATTVAQSLAASRAG